MTKTKWVKLPTLLEGEVVVIWLELSEVDLTRKEKLCKKLTPMESVSLDDFHKSKLYPGKASSVLYHIKLLALLGSGKPEAVVATIVVDNSVSRQL